MATAAVHSPLEAFVRDYVDVTGGVWDEIEPQVYDLLLPAEGAGAETSRSVDGREIVRVAFDPEAIPEHPAAQLVSFGTPLMDRLFTDAMQRGRFARMYIVGLNLTPHDLAGRLHRAFWTARTPRAKPVSVCQNVPPHQVPHHEVFCTGRYHREPQNVTLRHDRSPLPHLTVRARAYCCLLRVLCQPIAKDS